MKIAAFLLGAFIGAPTRFIIDQYFRSYMRFPLGILIANVAGSFLLGLLLDTETTTAFALMGFCGALTTWSAFALDLFDEAKSADRKLFALNLMSNYLCGVAAAALGIWIAQ